MYVGETTNLSVKIEPSNATNTEVKWSSGSSAKAAVDANGNVTAKKAGKVKIIAKVDGQRKTHEIEIVERKDKKLEDLGKVKITTITTTKPAELHVNSRNDAWIVNNCVNETEVTKTYKINASKDYVSSGAISLFLANKILGKTGDTIINYQVKENGKYVAWRTDWAKGNYEKIEFENFEQEMNKICEELMDGNPVAIAVNDENGNFRYVLAYAMTIPTQANPQFDAKDIYVIDPTIGGYKNLSDYYEFIEKATGEITYRIQCLNTKAVKMTLDSSSKTLDKGKTATLTPKFTNANVPKLKKVKSWTSSNTKVATVDSNGKVTAKGVGTATITAISAYPDDGSVKATCKITVKENNSKTFRFTYYTGGQTGSGLGPSNFKIDATLGCYTYKGNVVLAGATNALAKNWGVSKKNYIKYFNYNDKVTFTYNGKEYTGVILDSCGVSMNPSNYYNDNTNVLDMMFPNNSAAEKSGINQKKLTVYYK